MATFQLLHQLPEEVLQQVLSYLETSDLKQLVQTSRWCNEVGVPLLWKEVDLVDTQCQRQTSDGEFEEIHIDWHDDTPLILKLSVLATNPWIASQVRTLSHRCHWPPPSYYVDLQRMAFNGRTLSSDIRTLRLLQLAIRNLTGVQTLRLIHGHAQLNEVLLRCFFDPDRQRKTPVRRLWLENCRVDEGLRQGANKHSLGLALKLDFHGLESVRFRRLPLHIVPRQTGGGLGLDFAQQDYVRNRVASVIPTEDNAVRPGAFDLASRFNEVMYTEIVGSRNLPPESLNAAFDGGHVVAPKESLAVQRLKKLAGPIVIDMLGGASETLTSLTLDWVLIRPVRRELTHQQYNEWISWYKDLFGLCFPHLRAFQYRNAVVGDSQFPRGLYLLDEADEVLNFEKEIPLVKSVDDEPLLKLGWVVFHFLDAHPKLECLAWPMNRFFSAKSPSSCNGRVAAVIERLGRTLKDLRVDISSGGHNGPTSEEQSSVDLGERQRRRRFITHFAASMRRVESIKVKGRVPKDERRETIKALHACPLTKIVNRGLSSQAGNILEPEREGIRRNMIVSETQRSYSLAARPLEPLPPDYRFEANFGWEGEPPVLHTLASLHRDTVRELKFCGYHGLPLVFSPILLQTPSLFALKHFHALETLVMSMCFETMFEGRHVHQEIISYWRDMQRPTSTALVFVRDEEPEEGSWERELQTKYKPDVLAWRITTFLGPLLSEQAKCRQGGIQVRASFDFDGPIFDIDVRIGKDLLNSDICLSYKGPREEDDSERRREKLETRRWF